MNDENFKAAIAVYTMLVLAGMLIVSIL